MNFNNLEPMLSRPALGLATVPLRSPATSIILAALSAEQEDAQASRKVQASWLRTARKLITALRLQHLDFGTSLATAYTPAGPFLYQVRSSR
jgi:hypothetical protein